MKYFKQHFNFVVRVHKFMYTCSFVYVHMYMYIRAYKLHMNALLSFHQQEPQAITLGTEVVHKGIGAKRRRVEEKEKMVYIPLLDTLEAVLQNKNVVSEVHVQCVSTYVYVQCMCMCACLHQHVLLYVYMYMVHVQWYRYMYMSNVFR